MYEPSTEETVWEGMQLANELAKWTEWARKHGFSALIVPLVAALSQAEKMADL